MKDKYKVRDNSLYREILKVEGERIIKQLDSMCNIDYSFTPSLLNEEFLIIRRIDDR
jgi:hypothetical protein